jgi:hypothetical protein
MSALSRFPVVPSVHGATETDALSDYERNRLERNEQKIQDALLTFVEMGEALEDIRKNRLYREGFESFEDYCRKRWNFSRQRAYQLIEGAKIAELLSTEVTIWPTNEAQVRPLAGLSNEEATEAWKMAKTLAGKKEISGRIVKEAVSTLRKVNSEPDEKSNLPVAEIASSMIADESGVPPTCEHAEPETAPDREANSSTPWMTLPQTSTEHSDLPGTSFGLADGTVSDCYFFKGESDLLSKQYLESKLGSLVEINSKAPQRLRVTPEEMALRQRAFLKLAFSVNEIAGLSPSQSEKDQLYWAIETLSQATAFLRPYAQPKGKERDTPDV